MSAFPSEKRGFGLSHRGGGNNAPARSARPGWKGGWCRLSAGGWTPAQRELGGFLNLKFFTFNWRRDPTRRWLSQNSRRLRDGRGGDKKKRCWTRLCEKVPCHFLSVPSAGGRRLRLSERNVFKGARRRVLPWNRKWPPIYTSLSKAPDTCHTGARRRAAHHHHRRQTRRTRLCSTSRRFTRTRQWKSLNAIRLGIFPGDKLTRGQRRGMELHKSPNDNGALIRFV